MGSEFVERHKRKSVLAALLFIFQGRAKYVSIMLIVVLLSIPFMVSGETLRSFIELPAISAFLKGVGMGDLVASLSLKGNNDGLQAAMDRAAQESAQNSLWAKFLKSMNAPMAPAEGKGSLAMLRGGNSDLFGMPEVKDGKNMHRGPGQVAGAVNDEEKRRGETGDEVNLQANLERANGGGLYGDLMGTNLAGNFSGADASGNSPFLNRTMMKGPGLSADAKGSGMYSRAMNESASRVPVPSNPSKVNVKKMGKVSGFSWKNVGYKTMNAKVDVKLGSKKPMFQLAETFAMTGTAYKSKEAALEYQAAYTGTTYDGNDSNLDAIQTDAAAPVLPDTSFAGDLMNGAMAAQKDAEACEKADGQYSPKISEDGRQMDTIAKSLGKPPKCCSGGVGAWNAKINKLVYYCNDYNANSAALAAVCQSKGESMDCNTYSSMHIKPCSKWKCWLGFILAILLGALLFGVFGFSLVIAAIVVGSTVMFASLNNIITDFITGGPNFAGTSGTSSDKNSSSTNSSSGSK